MPSNILINAGQNEYLLSVIRKLPGLGRLKGFTSASAGIEILSCLEETSPRCFGKPDRPVSVGLEANGFIVVHANLGISMLGMGLQNPGG